MRRTPLLALIAATLLPACPGRQYPDVTDAAPSDADVALDDGATDADATPAQDVPPADVQIVPHCGPGAVPYPTDAGACFVANPLPDGGMPPPGRCAATVNTPVGTLRANEMDGDAVVLPNGHRIHRASDRRSLDGFPLAILRLPGTNLLVVTDGGIHTERLRVIDATSPTLAVVPGGEQSFPRDGTDREPALFYGLAFDPTARVLYASGGGGDRIYAYDVSTAGALSPNMARTIDLGITEGMSMGHTADGHLNAGYVSGLALSPDGTQLYAALQRGHALAIYDTGTRAMTRVVGFDNAGDDAPYPYAVINRPGDTQHVYVSLWGTRQVAEVDVNAGSVSRTWTVGKNPEELLFSTDGRLLYVAAADSDAINVVDVSLPAAPVRTTYLGGSMSAPRGISPTALAWGPGNRLYVVEADENAIDVLDANNNLARIGRMSSEWYPTDVDVASDGTVLVVTGKGQGEGPNNQPDMLDIDEVLQGSITRYAPPTDSALAAGDTTVTQDNTVMRSFNSVSCPDANYDFPIPAIGSTTPSSQIHHVILVVRENKTYDAVLGDYEGTAGQPANGDPTLTIVPRAQMPDTYPNLQALVRAFGNLDNYYSNAQQSIQGHVRTTSGRSTDYTERSWLTTWGRGTRVTPNQGLAAIGLPEEGTIFTAMAAANVPTEDWGEVIGNPTVQQRVGMRYPGIVFNMGVQDILKARAFGDWVQGTNNAHTNPTRTCQLASFTYIILPNDHTKGGQAGAPTPTSYIQDNDEATGFLVDAVSHSRFWPDTLIIVIEDDPSEGGDHVDNHRSLGLLVSPWVRRGYTSHVHFDESSLHHTIELVLGVPPHNRAIADAAPLYDAFTGTPDFTPYSYIPRRACEQLNPSGGGFAEESSHMDFSREDEARGLSRLLWRMEHNGQEPPWHRAPEVGDDDDDGE